MRIRWEPVLEHAADVVTSYDTGVTLRQLFYRLVADGTLPNLHPKYKALSRETTKARRDGWFPELVDRRRDVPRPQTFDSPAEARSWLREIYRRDRTEGQPFNLYAGCEKDALSALLGSWLDERDIPPVVVGGWHSEGYERVIERDLSEFGDGRKSVLLYVGDLDPAGEGIEDNVARYIGFDEVRRVALTWEQAQALALPENTDPDVARKLRNHAGRKAFEARYGRLFQIEVDAVEPDTLRAMLDEAIGDYWDLSAFEAAVELEAEEREQL